MIYINDHIISADISDIISKLKLQLASNGIQRFYKSIDTPNNYMICCPFHKDGQEKRPSMGILKKDGTCHCFACGWVGNLQTLVSNCLGYDDEGRQGEKWLIHNFVTLSVEERPNVDLDYSRNNSANNAIHSVDYVSEDELDGYRYNHPYWAERKITNPNIIELFDLGYDKKTDCIVFPIRDVHGRCLFVARRSTKTKYFNYPQGVEKPLYGLYELWQQAVVGSEYVDGVHKQDYYSRMFFPKEVIVCESMIDALTCWQYGKYAVALNGLGNDLQFKQLRELPCRCLILATDSDNAGMMARKRIAKYVNNKMLKQYMLPEGKKDINELSKEEFDNLSEAFV